MANAAASASLSAHQVGAYFVQQYYEIFQQQKDYMHRFYNDASSMTRIDGDTVQSAAGIVEIHDLIMSLRFIQIEIKTINTLESMNGGLLVALSGFVKSSDFSGWRNFVQTFFLAPQEQGYFVLNDMFHFAGEAVPEQPTPSAVLEQNHEYQDVYVDESELPVSENAAEEASEYMNAVHIGGAEPVEEYSFQDHAEDEYSEEERVEEETRWEEPPLHQSRAVEQEPVPAAEEPVGEPPKLSYASILLAAKGKPTPSVSSQPSNSQSAWSSSGWDQPSSGQSTWSASGWDQVPESSMQQSNNVVSAAPFSGVDVVEEAQPQVEEEWTSVYVRNLPTSVTSQEIFQEFKKFGRIQHDGVFLRNRKDTGVCYAFVEFEDVQSVRDAIQASPIQLAGRLVYIEERRPNNNGAPRGERGRGRGRGGFPGGRGLGRGNDQAGRNKPRSFRA